MSYPPIIYDKAISMDMFIEHIAPTLDTTFRPYRIFDIGSRDGNDAFRLKELLPQSHVYAFEASPEEYKAYRSQNEDIRWVNLAIYDRDGMIDFHIKDFNSGLHSIRDRGEEFGTKVIQVPCMRIDTFCDHNDIVTIDIVKIDTEGCTLEVLRSFGHILQTVKALHIETERVEYFKEQALETEVFNFLGENGFRMLATNTIRNLSQSDSIWVNQ